MMIWHKIDTFKTKMRHLTLWQWLEGWEVGELTIASQSILQRRINLPAKISRQSISSYLYYQQQELFSGIDSSYRFRYLPLLNLKLNEIDALWVVAYSNAMLENYLKQQHEQHRIIQCIFVDWQSYIFQHYLPTIYKQSKKKPWVFIYAYKTKTFIISGVQKKYIDLAMSLFGYEERWLCRTLEDITARMMRPHECTFYCDKHSHEQVKNIECYQWNVL